MSNLDTLHENSGDLKKQVAKKRWIFLINVCINPEMYGNQVIVTLCSAACRIFGMQLELCINGSKSC